MESLGKRKNRKTRARLYAEAVQPDRREWASAFNKCWICGWEPKHGSAFYRILETHEMARKSQAPGKWGCRENYFRTCTDCHRDLLSHMPIARQMAYKYLHDPEYFNPQVVNELRHRFKDAVTLEEVMQFVKQIKEKKSGPRS